MRDGDGEEPVAHREDHSVDARLPSMPEEEAAAPAAAREELTLRPKLDPPALLVSFLCLRTGDALNRVARALGLATRYGKKSVVAGAIATALTHDLPEVVRSLSEEERTVLREAAAAEGGLAPSQFAAKHRAAWPVENDYWGRPKETSALLAFGHMDDGLYVLAPGLAGPLRQLLGEPPPLTIGVLDELPEAIHVPRRWGEGAGQERPIRVSAGEPRAFAEVRRVLTLARAGKLAVTDKQRRPTEAAVRRVAELLAEPDFEVEDVEGMDDKWYQAAGPIRAHAWPVLAQQCGWCRPKAGKLVLTPAGSEFLASSQPQEYRAGVERFLLDDNFDELNRVPTIRGQGGSGGRYATPPSWRRDALMSSVDLWPVGRWVPFPEALRFAYATQGHVSVHTEPYRLYFAEQQYGHLASYSRDLTAVYLRALLFESLGTLGLVDVAYVHPHRLWPEFEHSWGTDDLAFCSRYDGLLFVRINALGAYCLHQTDTYEAQAAEPRALFSILPNQDIAVVGDAAEAAASLHILGQYAVQKGERLWRLDRRRMLDTVEAGGSVADLRAFLAAYATDGVPHTVEVLLNDLEAKAAAVRGMEDAVLIELATDDDAAIIAGHAETRRYCQRLGERGLAVRARDLARFRTALKKAGYALPSGR